MKKLFLSLAVVMSVSLFACGGSAEKACCDSDSVCTDTVAVVDTAAADTVAADTVAADSTVVAA